MSASFVRAGEPTSFIKLTYNGLRNGMLPSAVVFGGETPDGAVSAVFAKSRGSDFNYTSEFVGRVNFVALDAARLSQLDRGLARLRRPLNHSLVPEPGRYVSLTHLVPKIRKRDGALKGYRVSQYFLGMKEWSLVWPLFRDAIRGDSDMQTALDLFTSQTGRPVR